ncbi:MAG: GDP-mannose 4,6-dehydratase, partial [Pseudomonadota bacterium]
LGITIAFEGDDEKEVGRVASIDPNKAEQDIAVKPGDIIVEVDPRYFRPAEVMSLLGEPAQAKTKLGWQPKTSLEDMISEMVASDLIETRKNRLLAQQGFASNSTS